MSGSKGIMHLQRAAAVLLAVLVYLSTGNPPPAPPHQGHSPPTPHTPPSSGHNASDVTVTLPTCGMCQIAGCSHNKFDSTHLTWFEHSCPEYVQLDVERCIDYVAEEDGVNPHTSHHSAAPYNILIIFISFAIGAIIRYAFMNTGVPYTVILFIVGLIWGFLGKVEFLSMATYVQISDINPHLIFHIFLPVLIFESAFAMEIPIFKKVILHCLIMAGPGLMVASALTGAVAKYAFTKYEWDWYASLLFGTILSATDPVAVVALLKELGASPLISTLIEGESLLNDGTAIVFFSVLVEAIQKKSCVPDWESCTYTSGSSCQCSEISCTLDKSELAIFVEFIRVALGGPLIGLLFGIIAVYSLNKVFNDALIEITLTIATAYITFFTCEVFFHVSGVLGVVACGCYMSHFRQCISPDVEKSLHHFWEMTVYLTNTMIFILAGMIVALKAFSSIEPIDIGYLFITYATINVVRAFVLTLFTPILMCFEYKLTKGNACLVAWGGLRGAVGLALALVIQADDKVVLETARTKFVFHVAGIVMLTLCINGVTTKNLVAYFRLDEIPDRRRKMMSQRFKELCDESKEIVADLRAEPVYYDTNWEQVGRYSSLSLPSGKEDPYNETGWSSKFGTMDPDALKAKRAQAEGFAAYHNTLEASIHKQYAFGTLRREGVRELANKVVLSRERAQKTLCEEELFIHATAEDLGKTMNLAALIHAEEFEDVKEPLWSFPRALRPVMRPFWETINANPRTSEKMLRGRWQHAFDAMLGFIQMNKLVRNRIRSLCDHKVAYKIETHCKLSITKTVKMLSKVAEERPDISCSIKTRQAAQNVLNSMRADIVRMQHEARLDDQDAAALRALIEERMLRLTTRFSRSLQQSSALEALEDAEWFQASEPACRRKLLELATTEKLLRVVLQNEQLAAKECSPKSKRSREVLLPGLLLVISGIVQIRVGRKIFYYGSGYTLGSQQLMTGNSRFSDVWTESKCHLLLLPTNEVEALARQYPQFQYELWKLCGRNTTRMLIGMDDTGRFDPKVWDERTIRKFSRGGTVEVLQDPDGYDFDHERRHKLYDSTVYVLLRGRAWEYGEERDHIGGSLCRYPTIIPGSFKFATFTGHSVLFTIEMQLTAYQRARKRWGFLRSKIKSICLWSRLRSPLVARIALAQAFNRPPPKDITDKAFREKMRREWAESGAASRVQSDPSSTLVSEPCLEKFPSLQEEGVQRTASGMESKRASILKSSAKLEPSEVTRFGSTASSLHSAPPTPSLSAATQSPKKEPTALPTLVPPKPSQPVQRHDSWTAPPTKPSQPVQRHDSWTALPPPPATLPWNTKAPPSLPPVLPKERPPDDYNPLQSPSSPRSQGYISRPEAVGGAASLHPPPNDYTQMECPFRQYIASPTLPGFSASQGGASLAPASPVSSTASLRKALEGVRPPQSPRTVSSPRLGMFRGNVPNFQELLREVDQESNVQNASREGLSSSPTTSPRVRRCSL